jgi:hypothetical protein
VTGQKVARGRSEKPLRIRGHHLLCILGFRGLGYSGAFVAQMGRIVRRVRRGPRSRLVLLDSADSICAACPHLSAGGLCRNGKASARIRAKDRAILRRLGLKPGTSLSASAAYERVRRKIAPALLTGKLCARCRWRSLGCCAEGLERLLRAGAWTGRSAARIPAC